MTTNTLLALNNFSYSVLILVVVVMLKAFVTWLVSHEPLRFFHFYCHQLSEKVNKPENSQQQKKIAGFIAILVTLVPLAIILWLFEDFVAVTELWHALLLYLALGSFGLKSATKQIAQDLVANQSYRAKQTLLSLTLRDTDKLSPLGISKAAIEMQLLKTLQQGYVVACLYLIFGPLTALCYRLLLEMHYCWNVKLAKYDAFGGAAKAMVEIIQWLPVRLFSLLLLILSLGKNFLLFWRLSKPYFFQLNNNFALQLFALVLEIKLGGVAMYNQHKLRRVSFNDLAKQPQVTDIIHANKEIKLVIYLSFILLISLAIISGVVRPT